MDADDSGPHEARRIEDRTIHMRFGGEVHHGIEPMCRKELLDQLLIGDITVYERESAPIFRLSSTAARFVRVPA